MFVLACYFKVVTKFCLGKKHIPLEREKFILIRWRWSILQTCLPYFIHVANLCSRRGLLLGGLVPDLRSSRDWCALKQAQSVPVILCKRCVSITCLVRFQKTIYTTIFFAKLAWHLVCNYLSYRFMRFCLFYFFIYGMDRLTVIFHRPLDGSGKIWE